MDSVPGKEGAYCATGRIEPLKDVELFAQAAVDPELETVVWPNGADLAPEFLYQAVRQSSEATALR